MEGLQTSEARNDYFQVFAAPHLSFVLPQVQAELFVEPMVDFIAELTVEFIAEFTVEFIAEPTVEFIAEFTA
jgi:hypothetical protein